MPRRSKPHRTSMGYWRCRIDGKEHHLGKDRREAMRRFHRIMADSSKSPSARRPAVGAELVMAWLAENDKPDHHDRLKAFAEFIATDRAAAVGSDVLVKYHRQLTRKGYAAKMIAGRVRLARRALRWGKQNGWTDIEPDKVPTLLASLPDRVFSGRLFDLLRTLNAAIAA